MQMSRSESAAGLRKPRLQGGRLLTVPRPQPAAPFSATTVTSGLVTQLSPRPITAASLKESLGAFALQIRSLRAKPEISFAAEALRGEHPSLPPGLYRGEPRAGRPAGPAAGGRGRPGGKREKWGEPGEEGK